MNTADTEIKRWRIIVIQSLSEKDWPTGRELYNDILQYKDLQKKESVTEFYDVYSIADFKEKLLEIEKSLRDGDIVTLQIESHGCEAGIGLSSGEIMSWSDFYDATRPINVATGHLLFLVMAMCNSIAMISTIKPEERAPYRAMLCTTRNVYEKEIACAFQAFYSSFFNLLDISNAYLSLKSEIKNLGDDNPFVLLSAEDVYDSTFVPNEHFDSIISEQIRRFKLPPTTENMETMSKDLLNFLKVSHDKYCSFYNFHDLYKR